MAITKIQKVRSLNATINYVTKNEKTKFGKYISTYQCTNGFIARQFNDITEQRRNLSARDFSIESWMIIQSFPVDDNLSAEQAHIIGKQLASNYLNNNHQYVITTHIDAEHIHNHIVFNATNFKNFKSFDSKYNHIITDLRKENDNICKLHGLNIIESTQGKGISQREYYARKKGNSYKCRLENLIDTTIKNVDTYQEFLESLDRILEVKFNKNISMKFPEQTRFTRLSRLGIDYSVSSIKYRINNKHENTQLNKIDFSLIDKNKFENEKGLINWATNENINKLTENIKIVRQSGLTTENINNKIKISLSSIKNIESSIKNIDNQIDDLNNFIKYAKIYKSSASMIANYKSSKNKLEFKKTHYKEFKKYDQAKKFLKNYTDKSQLPSIDSVQNTIDEMRSERDILYAKYQSTKTIHNDMIKSLSNEKDKSDIKKEDTR